MKGKSLLKNFTLLSFFAFFITGVVLVLFLNRHMKEDKINSVERTLHLTLHYIIEPGLSVSDIERGIDEIKIKKLDNKLKGLIDDHTLMGIKILNNNNEEIYSLHSENLQNYSSDNNKFQNEVQIKKGYKVINLPSDKEASAIKKESKILIAYFPITMDNFIVGNYEVYTSYDEIETHTQEVIIKVSIIVFSGLIILYLLLIKIVYNSSKTLILQNNTLLRNKIELQEAYDKLNSAYKNTIEALSNAIDARDPYTAGHSKRVSEISLEIGRELSFSKDQLELLELSALFHDIGKLGIKDEILLKTNKLTDNEFNIIKQHSDLGVKIISNIDFLRKSQAIILHHHEKFNGSGYPLGISGEDIPLESRIITVADSYDAMTSDRPYRKGMHHSAAVDELIKNQDTQFDTNVVQAFLKAYAKKPLPS